jgi:5-methylcytosine-specific restriction enzyme B
LQTDYTTKSAVHDEGLWLQQHLMKLTWFDVIALVMLDLNRPAKVAEVVSHQFYQIKAATADRKDNLTQNAWYYLQRHTPLSSKTVNQSVRGEPAVFDKTEKSEWILATGSEQQLTDLKLLLARLKAGPTKDEQTKHYRFVTFHQSYGYEEFIEGLRPVLADNDNSADIRYEIKDGVFKELCKEAELKPNRRFAMVIDEINRGNISKIFGELITLIETDKRAGMQHAIPVTLPYSGKPFSVPANVDIIGTMNTADRSLALIDTALRRRFDFVPVMPDSRDLEGAPLHGLRVAIDGNVINIPRMLTAINQRIEALYDRDHCIGHAYFTSLANVENDGKRFAELSNIFRNRIIPLLEEYFFEDWQKIRLVLADNQKAEQVSRFVVQKEELEEGLVRLFGRENSLDSYATKMSYELQKAALTNPAAYIGIYDTFDI